MRKVKVTTYQAIVDYLGCPPNTGKYVYRGTKINEELIPSLLYGSNIRLRSSQIKAYEHKLLENFAHVLKNEYAFVSNLTDINSLKFWFLSRHFHLKSRLIDFSGDLSISLQFCMQYAESEDALVYAIPTENLNCKHLSDIKVNPFCYNKTCLIKPSLNYTGSYDSILPHSRMFIQLGWFLFQPIKNIFTPFTLNDGIIFQIPLSAFKQLKHELYQADIDISKSVIKQHHCLDIVAKTLNKALI